MIQYMDHISLYSQILLIAGSITSIRNQLNEVMILDEIMKELDSVYKTVSSIPVTGDAVDAMAVVRAKLRKIYAELDKAKEEVTADGDGV